MLIGKKNKVHSTFDPPAKTTQQPDHQQLSKILQQVSGQLNLMLELQQQQQQAKNSYSTPDSCNEDAMEDYDQYKCSRRHHHHQAFCHGNPTQSSLCCNNTRIFHQKRHQQYLVSPSLSSFFSSTHPPQNQCMSICPHDVFHHQKPHPPCHQYQPSFGDTSFQQSQCSNSAIHRYQHQSYYHPQRYYNHCTAVNHHHDPCSCTHTDISTAITSPQSTTVSPRRNMNVSDPTYNHTDTSFEKHSYCKNNTTWPLSVRATATASSSSTRTKINKSGNNPPFPGLATYDMDIDTTTTMITSNDCYDDDDDDDDNQQRRQRQRQRPHQRSTTPPFPILANTTPSSPSPPPLPPRTENLLQHGNHQQLSWTDIYRQDLLSRQDALISPPVSSCNNINAIHMNKVKKNKSDHSHLRGWWIHVKFRWNQLRKKKFTLCFR